MVEVSVSKNWTGEEGVDFFTANENSLYFIPLRHLPRVELIYSITEDIHAENISLNVIRIALQDWSTIDVLKKLAGIIIQRFPNNEIDWAETFWAINLMDTKKKLAREFFSREPGLEENMNKKVWKEKFNEYVNKHGLAFKKG